MSFHHWYQRTIEEAHERYRQEEEQLREAEAEKENDHQNVPDRSYKEYLEDWRKQLKASPMSNKQRLKQDRMDAQSQAVWEDEGGFI